MLVLLRAVVGEAVEAVLVGCDVVSPVPCQDGAERREGGRGGSCEAQSSRRQGWHLASDKLSVFWEKESECEWLSVPCQSRYLEPKRCPKKGQLDRAGRCALCMDATYT